MDHSDIFFDTFLIKREKTPQHGVWEVCIGVISEGCPSVTSDEHIPWVWFWCCIHFLNELYDGTSHQVRFIDSKLGADGGHIFFDCVRHSKTSLVLVFDHRHFLSSFWIWLIILLTVSRIRFSLGLLFRGFLLKPHRGLKSGSFWLFFIKFTPVYQSL